MIDAQEHNSFYFADKKLKNLKELLFVLDDPAYSETAKGYVNETKNDFSNWIAAVLLEKTLADEISREKSIPRIAELIRKKVEEENRPLIEDKIAEKKEIAFSHLENAEVKTIENVYFDTIKKTTEENAKKDEASDSHIDKETKSHEDIMNNDAHPRHFCPKFFDCMRKEFLFGFGLGIIVGIVIAILIRIGAV